MLALTLEVDKREEIKKMKQEMKKEYQLKKGL